MVELEEGEKWLPLAVCTIQINISLGELTAIFNMLCHQVGGPPPCPALRGERGGGKPGEEEPGAGRRMEPTVHLKTIAFIAFILIFGLHHFAVTSTSGSCGQKPYTGG